MEAAINYIQSQNIQDYIKIIKVLMEQAEKLSADGSQKLDLVISAWNEISNLPQFQSLLGNVPLDTVTAVIEAIILATKTSIAVNKSTGCWTSFKALFKGKSSTPAV